MSSPAGGDLTKLMGALTDWEEARGTAQEEALLAAWTAFRESFHVQTENRLLEIFREAFTVTSKDRLMEAIRSAVRPQNGPVDT